MRPQSVVLVSFGPRGLCVREVPVELSSSELYTGSMNGWRRLDHHPQSTPLLSDIDDVEAVEPDNRSQRPQ